MNTNAKLDAKTKEIGMGVRREASVVSELQRRINELRTRTSGILEFRDWLADRTGFDDFETELKNRAADRPDVDDSDCTTARDIVESNFADFDSYTGDQGSGTGVFAQTTFDDYRGYLTSNGVSSSDADRHLQPIKRLFTTDDLFIRKVDEDFSSFEDLKDWLFENGFDLEAARDFIDKLKAQFNDFSDFESSIKNDIDLEDLLSEFDHSPGESPGSAGIEKQGDTLILYGDTIDHQPVSDDSGSGQDPPETLSWSMQTSAQSIDEGESLTITAGGSAGTSEDWETQVGLVVGGSVTQRQAISVTGGNATASFTFTRFSANEYDVQIGDSSAITITVLPTTDATAT